MPLCICYSCQRKMDCDASGMCDICEADADGYRPETVVAGGRTRVEYMPMDKEIHVILKKLHRELGGAERECRWRHSDAKQIYWCEHVVIPARDVTEQYWNERKGTD